MPKPVYDNIGPRFGGAWEITPSTVLRAGYSLMWDPLPARSQYVQNDIEAASWPWTTAFSGVANNVVGNPVQSINTIEGAFPVPVPAASPWSTGGYYDDPNFKDAYSHQWNVEVQRQLTSTMMFSVAYVGSKNGRLPYTGYGNAARTASPNGTPLATVDTLRPMPFMIGSLRYSRSIGKSRYNALQTKFERRLSGGLHTLVSYTWSRSMDNSSGWFAAENGPGGGSAVQNFFDPDSNYSVSSYDIPHFLSWSTVCDLPFGEGKRWLQSGPLSWIAGGWQVNSILQVRSGQPYNLVVNGDVANISGTGSTVSGYARPNLIGNPIPAQQTADMWYDPTAFAVPVGSFGNFGRNVLRSSRVINVDLSAFRDIRVGANRHLQLRVEAFNVFNIQNLGVPATTIGQAGAGRITSIVGTPRQVQLGIRFVF
jgi:hypothetical protein